MKQNHRIPKIGQSLPRKDACAKVTGAEKYAGDHHTPDMLIAGVKRAGIPHARIQHIDTASASAVDGAVVVLTHKDIKGKNRQGVIRKDQPVLADDRVRHCGDAVAMVVAETREALRQALDRIRVAYDPLPGLFDPEQALEPGAVRIHDDNPEGNLLIQGVLEKGDVDAAFTACAHVVEGRFEVPFQEHAYLETESGWAVLRDDGRLHITASTQTPFRDRMEVAEALGLSIDRIRIIAPYCGGAFGGKDGITVQSLLGLAALHCPGRPVRMRWDREESFVASPKRHPARLEYRLGATADGTLHALTAHIVYDTGPYDHLGGAVTALGLEHAGGPYRIPNTRLEARAAYTNNPVGGAFRAFGVAQVTAAMEQMLDILCAQGGFSPLDIRLRNAVERGDVNSAGVTLTGSTGLSDCLEKIRTHPLWREREVWKSGAGAFKERGVGIASVMHGMGYGPVVPDIANAKIELTPEGTFRIYSGVVDMGQGNAGTYVQIAGDILNQGADRIELVLPDTDRTLPSGSASASRTTYSFGNALIGAAHGLKDRLLSRAADAFMVNHADEMALLPGRIRHLSTNREIPLQQMARILNDSERIATHRFRMPTAKDMPTKDERLRLHGIPHLIFSYGAHLACVEVDRLTGRVEIKQYLAISDCGRIINPQLFEQQIHGGIAQGIGYALCEDFKVENGVVRTPDFTTYILPTALDIPDLNSLTVEIPEPSGPYGLKGVGEIATDGPLPAVANAVFDACGIRMIRTPLTAEQILAHRTRSEGGNG